MEESNIQFVIDENGYKHYLKEVLGGGGQGVTWKTEDPNILIKMKVNPSTGEPVVDEEEYSYCKAGKLAEETVLWIYHAASQRYEAD